MSNTKQTKKLYVSLDSLLDTRLGVLNTIDPIFALDVTSSKDYFTREIDLFTSNKFPLKKENYDLVYKDFKEDVLKNSLSTRMFSFLTSLTASFIKQLMVGPEETGISIDLNIYPYSFLSDKELVVLKQTIEDGLYNVCPVNIINLSPKELTLSYVRETYSGMIMYHSHEWLNLYENELKTKGIRDVTIYIPAISFNSLPSKKDLDEIGKLNMTAFELIKQALSVFVTIEFLPICFYCVNSSYNLDEYSDL